MATLKTLTINGKQYEVVSVAPTASVTLLADGWEGGGDAYSQVVELAGVTSHTKVDLQPTPEQVEIFLAKTIAFVAENNNGVVTVYSIGHKPKNNYTIQVTLTEVEGEAPIRGNTVGLPNPQPDWNQDDPAAADYIKNKPKLTIATYDLAAMGLSAVPLSGGFSVIEADTTEIRAALDKGAVTFVIPINAGGITMQANITMIGANANGAYQCISIVNYTTPGTVTVNIADTMIQVVYAPLDGVPAVGINLSGFESEGKIVETFADGSTATTVMEFDANGKPTKITDGNGNVTVLTW